MGRNANCGLYMGGVFLNNSKFYSILPLKLIYDQQYATLSAKAIILYSLILNRMKLSFANNDFHDNGGIFIHYSSSKISEHLHCGKSMTRSILHELESVGLIKVKQQSGLPLKIYVNDVFGIQKPTYTNPTPQDKPIQKPKSSYKPAVNREASFDMSLTDQMTSNHLMSFAEKKKKRKSH